MPPKAEAKAAANKYGKEDIYEITCEGQYYNGKKDYGSYKVSVRLPESARGLGWLSTIKNMVLKDVVHMSRLYPDWKRYRTHVITRATNLTNERAPIRDLSVMNRGQIIKYIDYKGLEIEPELYPELPELRQAVRSYAEDPTAFLKFQEKLKERVGPQMSIRKALLSLNPELTLSSEGPQSNQTSIPTEQSVDGISVPEIDDKKELEDLMV